MLHKKKVNRGFTLVELLAVIVILAIILVIAVPKIMSVITDSKKSTLETSAKMIASSAEKIKLQNKLLGKENDEITCDSVAKLSNKDYSNCTITFNNNEAIVSINGIGKFNGINVCNATKNNAKVSEDKCPTDARFFTYNTNIDEDAFVYSAEVVDVDKCKSFFMNNWLRQDSDATNICNNVEDEYDWNLQQNASNAIYYKYTSKLSEMGLKGTYKKITNVEIENKDSCIAYLINKWGEEDYDEYIEPYCSGGTDSDGDSIDDYILKGSIPVTDFEIAGLNVEMEGYIPTAIIASYDIDGGENVVIPKEIDGYKVDEVLNYALYNENIKSIEVPKIITKINDCAFGEKSRLTSSNISSSYTCNNKPTNGALTIINKIGDSDILNSYAQYNNTTYHAGIRYISDDLHNSKNYVKYNCDNNGNNCEIWRIIGVFNVEGEQRIKLVNTFSTFRTVWDSSSSEENGGEGINQWGPSVYEDGSFYEGADLYQLLNGFYIGESTTCVYCSGGDQATCSNACTAESLSSANMKPLTSVAKSLISNVNWSTNPSSWYITPAYRYPLYYNLSNIYLREIGVIQTTFANYCDSGRVCDDKVVRTKETNALVGLMSLLDFGYTLVNNDFSMNKYTFINDNELRFWLLTPNVIKLRVFTGDDDDSSYPAGDALFAIYPSVYLKSNVNLNGTGDDLGSIDNPYTLSID